MIILIIIGIVLFILALINWGQSLGHSKGIFRLFGCGTQSDSTTNEKELLKDSTDVVTLSGSGSSGASLNANSFSYDEDYAYNDDQDYFSSFFDN